VISSYEIEVGTPHISLKYLDENQTKNLFSVTKFLTNLIMSEIITIHNWSVRCNDNTKGSILTAVAPAAAAAILLYISLSSLLQSSYHANAQQQNTTIATATATTTATTATTTATTTTITITTLIGTNFTKVLAGKEFQVWNPVAGFVGCGFHTVSVVYQSPTTLVLRSNYYIDPIWKAVDLAKKEGYKIDGVSTYPTSIGLEELVVII